jgi:hypothetical protein
MSASHISQMRKRSNAASAALAIGLCTLVLGCSRPGKTVVATSVAMQRPSSNGQTGSGLFRGAVLHGAESCAASGCHGKALDGTRDWKSAWSIWFAEDPHRRAFDVLYAERSIDIYRHVNLVDSLSEKLEESAYSDFLQQRCVGCHASPSLMPALPPAIDSGVACQSCHGPAGGWIDRHYLDSWKGGDGFRDLKDLPTRAEVCTSCHVGPVVGEDGTSYHVDHELIAADKAWLPRGLAPKPKSLCRRVAKMRRTIYLRTVSSTCTSQICRDNAGKSRPSTT